MEEMKMGTPSDKEMKEEKPSRNFDLTSFARVQEKMIATSNKAYEESDGWSSLLKRKSSYKVEDIEDIINSDDIKRKQTLSRDFFNRDGYYKQIILYFATLLKYTGLLIPNPKIGTDLSTPHISKRYFGALDYLEVMKLPTYFSECVKKVLVDGCYYGLKTQVDKKTFAVIDLPADFCRTYFKDVEGNDIVEFDLEYFKSISNEASRKEALKAYPNYVQKAFKKYTGKSSKSAEELRWLALPSEDSICFTLFGTSPLLLSTVAASVGYDAAVALETERNADEIHKIVVQKVPHASDNSLLFEPEEAAEIHSGTVKMLKGQKNTSVITSYCDVDVVQSNNSAQHTDSYLSKMEKNIYAQSGASDQVFTSESVASVEYSIKKNIALVMCIARKFADMVTTTLNRLFGNGNIDFKYEILPITFYNDKEYLDDTFKLVGSGYSFLLPALATGLSQRDLCNIKNLENNLLKLNDILKPLETSYTQSAKGKQNSDEDSEGGRPKVEEKDKAEQTIKNEESKNNTGGSDK